MKKDQKNLEFLKSSEYGKYVVAILDFFVPLALKLPKLREDPNLMTVTVKATGASGVQDVVTEADKFMQKKLKEEVARLHPDWQFWGEEDEDNISVFDTSKQFLFITDPIEGTNNFRAKKDNLWGSVVALVNKEEPVIGIVAHPATKTFYVGIKGQGAYILRYNEDGHILAVNLMTNKPEDDRFTYNDSPHFSLELSEIVKKFLSLGADKFVDLESGALEVIRNRGTIYFKTSNEMAAVFVILGELGGIVTDADGNPWSMGINSLISARNKEDYDYLKNLSDKARGVS